MTLEGHFFTLNLLKPAGSQFQDVSRLGGGGTNTKHHTFLRRMQLLLQPQALLGEDSEGSFRPSERQESPLCDQHHVRKKHNWSRASTCIFRRGAWRPKHILPAGRASPRSTAMVTRILPGPAAPWGSSVEKGEPIRITISLLSEPVNTCNTSNTSKVSEPLRLRLRPGVHPREDLGTYWG